MDGVSRVEKFGPFSGLEQPKYIPKSPNGASELDLHYVTPIKSTLVPAFLKAKNALTKAYPNYPFFDKFASRKSKQVF